MTFEKAEDAWRQVSELGEKLRDSSSRDDAGALGQACRRFKTQIRGDLRYGYVAEKLTEVITAAKMYKKNERDDLRAAKSVLGTALLKVEHAMIPLRNADRSQWQE